MNAELQAVLADIQASTKAINADLVRELGGLKQSLTEQVKRMDALEVKAAKPGDYSGGGESNLLRELKANSEIGRLLGGRNRGGTRFELEWKTLSSSSLGFPTAGVMPADRVSDIVAAPRPQLHMLNVLPVVPTTQGEVHWVRESSRPSKASPVVEFTGSKPLVEPSFTADSERVEVIACLMLASKQVLEDYPELDAFLRGEGMSRVLEELDKQILSGSGISPNLNGLVTQGTAWDLTLLNAADGYEYPDIISGAFQQLAEADEVYSNPFVVLHPGDACKIRRLKTTTGEYLFDNTAPLVLFGGRVVETTQITKGTFLVGYGDSRVVEYRQRQDVMVEISSEDSTNFRLNLVTLRFECRGALIVKRPTAFIQGSLTQSPA